MRGLFVTFEGVDGCGKSLMLKLAAQTLSAEGCDVLCTREPGGSELGAQLRRLLLDSAPGTVDERGEALMYAADRALHVAQVIRPALAAGRVVLCDRYLDSTYAYQGGGRGMNMDALRALNEFASYELLPDVTFLLDLPTQTALDRLRGKRDRMEQENVAFFERTAQTFRALATAEPQRFAVIDATQAIADEQRQIMDILRCALRRR